MGPKIILLSFIIFLFANMSMAGSFWPVFQRDFHHTGFAPVTTAESPELLWQQPMVNDAGDSHLVLSDDGSIWTVGFMAGKYSPNGDHTLLVNLTMDVGIQGQFSIIGGSPVLLSDGTLIATGNAGQRPDAAQVLFAIGPDGDLDWTFELSRNPSAIRGFITLGPDESIYAGRLTKLFAISHDSGTPALIWSYDCDANVTSIPGVASDGTVYFGAANGLLYSVSSEGSLNWSFAPTSDIRPEINSAPTIG
ncbi:MAG: PQQ-like beta-propeller repeat protein, partial [Candidatus Coatesbacteria bacterium]|nr:PQQ-like beta-propeller repeat protein [Candidatus Coatesbacteria bacterium]